MNASVRSRRGNARNAPVSFPTAEFPAGTSRIIQVTIPKAIYNKLKRGRSWFGRLTVEVRAQGTKSPRDRTLSVGLYR